MIIIDNAHALKWAVIGWLTKPNQLIFWTTASHGDVTEAQASLVRALMYTTLDIKRVIRTNGGERILLENGSRVIFHARSSYSSRGVSADYLVLAQREALTDMQRGALLPVISAIGGEVVYSG